MLSHCGRYVGRQEIQPLGNNALAIYIATTIRDAKILINGKIGEWVMNSER